ncbi:MAG: hypothetical protein RI958_724, partial [Actinomycetota bacterium]
QLIKVALEVLEQSSAVVHKHV